MTGKQMRPDLSGIRPYILAGGPGKRLWPLSRPSCPKPFVRLPGKLSLLQMTVSRLRGFTMLTVITAGKHQDLSYLQLRAMPDVPDFDLVLEPCQRNTAPACILAALHARYAGARYAFVMPSDHYIGNPEQLWAVMPVAKAAADAGRMVVFGICPGGPETRYGYIRAEGKEGAGYAPVHRFVEKPDAAKAQKLVNAGDCYWNSGMIFFRPDDFLSAMRTYQPEMFHHVEAAYTHGVQSFDNMPGNVSSNGAGLIVEDSSYRKAANLSVDYSLLENAGNMAVVPVDLVWSDLGTWGAYIRGMFANKAA